MKSNRTILISYDEFRNDPDILDIRREIAKCRELSEDFTKAIKEESLESKENFMRLNRELLSEREELDELLLDEVMETIETNYNLIFPSGYRLTPKHVQAMAQVHKITAGIVKDWNQMTSDVRVQYDVTPQLQDQLVAFCKIIYPYIPSDSRPALMAKLEAFLPDSRKSLRSSAILPGEEVLEENEY